MPHVDLVERPVVGGASRRCTRRSTASRARGSSPRRQTSPSGNQIPISRSADSGESEPCTRLFGIASANSPRSDAGIGVGGVRRADRLAAGRDRALAFEHERERRPGGDEVDELAEERLLAVLGVVRLAELARLAARARAARSFRPRRSKRARISPARLRSTASGLARMRVRSTAMRPGGYPTRARRRRGASPGGERHDVVVAGRSASRSTGTPATAASSGRLQVTHACRSLVVQTGQTRKSSSTSARQTGQCRSRAAEALLHRLDLELALAHVLEVLGRPEEHVDQRPDERRSTPSRVETHDEQRILDPAPRVLVHPVDGRDPEDDHEEDARDCGSRTTSTSGRSRARCRSELAITAASFLAP